MSAVPASRPLQPVSSSERIQYIDVLRGFALYGVLLANIIWMACDMVLTPAATRQLPTHAADRIVKYLVVFFIDGKFITLFSFLFAVGFTLQMRGYIHQIGDYIPTLRRAMPWLLAIGVVGNAASVASEWARTVLGIPGNRFWLVSLEPLIQAGVICLSAFYAGGIALLLRSARWALVLAPLAAVGRMALTNYLTHSLVYLLVLTGAGLGLIGHIGATVCLAITVVLFGLQIAYSNWWLRHYRFGPAEWLWRSLTYGRMQPMRIDTLASL
jgi:uncharacterized protein